MIKKLNNFKINESVQYNIEPSEYTDRKDQESIVDGYIDQIERAILPFKVEEVDGQVSESDCDLYFHLNDGNEIRVNYTYHPNGGLMKVMVVGSGFESEKSHGMKNTWGDQQERGKNPEYGDLNTGEDVYQMVKDVYMEEGLIELEVTHQIVLPKDSFNTEFFYDINPETNQHSVEFSSEEAAKAWIESLKINIIG
jgi:hypothetical protein